MAKSPKDRYASAGELLLDVHRAFGDTLEAGSTPSRPVAAPEETGVRDGGATRPAGPGPPRDAIGGVTAASPVAGVGAPTTPAHPAAPTAPAARTARTGSAPAAAPPRRGMPLAALAAGLGVVAAIAGFVLGGSSDDQSTSQELSSSASAGTLGLSFPDGWRRVSEQPDVPGMRFSQPIVLAPEIRDARLVAGQVNGSGPTLLPAAFLDRLPKAPSRDDRVKLGSLEAYRYEGLAPEGTAQRVTVYAAPTTADVATVACVSPPASAAEFAQDCERVAASLQLTGAKPLALGPREDYAKGVGAAFEQLDSAVDRESARLRRADTPSAQAAAAAALARAYRNAASGVSKAPAGPYERKRGAAVADSLRAVGDGYARAADAARDGDRAAYAAARRSVRRSGRALARSLRRLEALGYQVG